MKKYSKLNVLIWCVIIPLIMIGSIIVAFYLAYNKEFIKQKAEQKVINFKKNNGIIVKYLDYQEK